MNTVSPAYHTVKAIGESRLCSQFANHDEYYLLLLT